jgi:hypothetical protein
MVRNEEQRAKSKCTRLQAVQFKRALHRQRFDNCEVIKCYLDGLAVTDEAGDTKLGTYRCDRVGSRCCSRDVERHVLPVGADEVASRMKVRRVLPGTKAFSAIVCARCYVLLCSRPHDFGTTRPDKADETLVLTGDDTLECGEEGTLPSRVSNASKRGRRRMTWIEDMRWETSVFRGKFGIPADLFEEVVAGDASGIPMLMRRFMAFRAECAGFRRSGLIPPAKTAARGTSLVCDKVAWAYTCRKYADESVSKRIRRNTATKRSLVLLLNEYKLIY